MLLLHPPTKIQSPANSKSSNPFCSTYIEPMYSHMVLINCKVGNIVTPVWGLRSGIFLSNNVQEIQRIKNICDYRFKTHVQIKTICPSTSPFLPLFPTLPPTHKTKTTLQASAQLREAHTWGAVSVRGAMCLRAGHISRF